MHARNVSRTSLTDRSGEIPKRTSSPMIEYKPRAPSSTNSIGRYWRTKQWFVGIMNRVKYVDLNEGKKGKEGNESKKDNEDSWNPSWGSGIKYCRDISSRSDGSAVVIL
jgi:hypothetical protein